MRFKQGLVRKGGFEEWWLARALKSPYPRYWGYPSRQNNCVAAHE